MSHSTRTFYQIRDRSTGLYSTGGADPRWSKKGKAWVGSGPLRNHIHCYRDAYGSRKKRPIPESWEVVELRVVTEQTEVGSKSAREWMG